MLETGQPAPDFTLPRDGGGTLTLSDLRPSRVVLFFYPRDDTPGCTTESLDFTAARDDFRAAGAEIVGISKDTVAKHDKFRDKHDLGIPLVSDADGTTCEDYGTWKQKQMYGKTFCGIERTTVLIGPNGTVEQLWRGVKVPGHVAEVLDAVRSV